MSAAQPADPAHPHTPTAMNGPDDAAVIPLSRGTRRSNSPLRAVRGRWHMRDQQPDQHHPQPGPAGPPPAAAGTSPPTGPHTPTGDPGALAAWAETIETSMLEIGQSLTDPATRDAYLVTLTLWDRILHGSHAAGVIDDATLNELMIPLNGMRKAPGILDEG